MVGGVLLNTFVAMLLMYFWQPRPQGFSLKKLVGREFWYTFFILFTFDVWFFSGVWLWLRFRFFVVFRSILTELKRLNFF